MELIELTNVTRKYGTKTAVDSVSFSIKEGESFALLGPNGAGKTTLLSLMTTVLYPTKGRISIMGFDSKHQGKDIRKLIGVVFQEFLLDDDMTARRNLDVHARLYKMDRLAREQAINNVLRLVNLEEEQNHKVSTFSGGMKR
ncbi:ABC transporter ATP-binding protein, partial [Candidatus Woesearchaeota archaeon]|nr:ABC transporter ATP-binding protein [Candidatus Woesearchaeota archaeon]